MIPSQLFSVGILGATHAGPDTMDSTDLNVKAMLDDIDRAIAQIEADIAEKDRPRGRRAVTDWRRLQRLQESCLAPSCWA